MDPLGTGCRRAIRIRTGMASSLDWFRVGDLWKSLLTLVRANRITPSNAVSLFCGVVGNLSLLLNFTQTVRYIITLPVTIVSWFLASGIVSCLSHLYSSVI